MQYLKKRRLYALAVEKLALADMPKCTDCHYSFHGDYEWLKFETLQHSARFTVYKCGKWSRVIFEDESGIIFDKVLNRVPVVGILTCQ